MARCHAPLAPKHAPPSSVNSTPTSVGETLAALGTALQILIHAQAQQARHLADLGEALAKLTASIRDLTTRD